MEYDGSSLEEKIVIMPTNDAVPYDTNFDLQQSNVTQEPLRKFPQQQHPKYAGGVSDENVTSKRIHASRNKVDAVNMALNERFEEIKSTVVGEVPHEASYSNKVRRGREDAE